MNFYFRGIYLSLPGMYKSTNKISLLNWTWDREQRRKHGCGSVVFVASWRCNCSKRRELLARNLASWGCRLDLLCLARSSIRRQQGAGLLSLPRPGQHHLLLPRARIRWDCGPWWLTFPQIAASTGFAVPRVRVWCSAPLATQTRGTARMGDSSLIAGWVNIGIEEQQFFSQIHSSSRPGVWLLHRSWLPQLWGDLRGEQLPGLGLRHEHRLQLLRLQGGQRLPHRRAVLR